MKVRVVLASLSACALMTACATTGGGGGGASGSTAPAGSSAGSTAGSGADSGTGSGGAASTGSAATGAGTGAAAGAASAGRGGGSADPGVPARTPAERRADVDGQLDASLDKFDEQLRREQQRVASERDSQTSARAADAVIEATMNEEGAGDEIRRNRAGDLQSVGVEQQAAAGSGSIGGGGVDAKPIPSGVDDDIVARRLRRAAEAETDPELKEKLWKEYRDYKENTKGSTS